MEEIDCGLLLLIGGIEKSRLLLFITTEPPIENQHSTLQVLLDRFKGTGFWERLKLSEPV